MPIIPIGSTGMPAQYPFRAVRRFHNSAVLFLDGAAQYFPDRKQPSLEWQMQYQKLNSAELAQWSEFLAGAIGQSSTFPYADPATGAVYENSRISGSDVEVAQEGPGGVRIEINIRNVGV